jgi:hypothetical protein
LQPCTQVVLAVANLPESMPWTLLTRQNWPLEDATTIAQLREHGAARLPSSVCDRSQWKLWLRAFDSSVLAPGVCPGFFHLTLVKGQFWWMEVRPKHVSVVVWLPLGKTITTSRLRNSHELGQAFDVELVWYLSQWFGEGDNLDRILQREQIRHCTVYIQPSAPSFIS